MWAPGLKPVLGLLCVLHTSIPLPEWQPQAASVSFATREAPILRTLWWDSLPLEPVLRVLGGGKIQKYTFLAEQDTTRKFTSMARIWTQAGIFLLFYFFFFPFFSFFLNSRALKISGANVSVHRIETSVGTFTTRMCLRRTGKTLQMTGSWLHPVPGWNYQGLLDFLV